MGTNLLRLPPLPILLLLLQAALAQHATLRLVSVLYRHGDRTPTRPFPNDPWKNAWSQGLGQLTNVGKDQQYKLGQFLREKYGGFLDASYNESEIVVRSTDVDRTLMSAYCNLAGFYPPNKKQTWNSHLDWQPIPVHTRPVSGDYLLSYDAKCPRYDELLEEVKQSEEVKAFDKDHEEFYKQLGNYTGANVSTLFDISSIYDTLFIEKLKNMTIPPWADDALLQVLEECDQKDFLWSFKTKALRRLRGGSLVGEMVNHMHNRLEEKGDSHKAFIYSAHDMTIAAFLSALDVYDGVQPPYASAVVVELHEDNGNASVRILYRNTTQNDYELHVPGCSDPCSYEQFKQLTTSVIPEDIERECQATSTSRDTGTDTLIGAVAGIILGCALSLLVAAGINLYRRKANRCHYMNIRADI